MFEITQPSGISLKGKMFPTVKLAVIILKSGREQQREISPFAKTEFQRQMRWYGMARLTMHVGNRLSQARAKKKRMCLVSSCYRGPPIIELYSPPREKREKKTGGFGNSRHSFSLFQEGCHREPPIKS